MILFRHSIALTEGRHLCLLSQRSCFRTCGQYESRGNWLASVHWEMVVRIDYV